MLVMAGFPEFDFCPLGGPPGWFNRMTGKYDQRYFYPPLPRVNQPLLYNPRAQGRLYMSPADTERFSRQSFPGAMYPLR